jgi:hypothetical protein
MAKHVFVADRVLSIARGVPWTDEAEVGASTLPSFIREVTERFSGREALVQRDVDGAIDRWSYRDLWDRSVEVAKALIASGLGKGDRVGVLMTNRAEFLSAVFGATLAGGVAAPLSTFHAPSDGNQHLAGNPAGLMGEPTDNGGDELGPHGRILGDVEALGHARHGAWKNDVRLHAPPARLRSLRRC